MNSAPLTRVSGVQLAALRMLALGQFAGAPCRCNVDGSRIMGNRYDTIADPTRRVLRMTSLADVHHEGERSFLKVTPAGLAVAIRGEPNDVRIGADLMFVANLWGALYRSCDDDSVRPNASRDAAVLVEKFAAREDETFAEKIARGEWAAILTGDYEAGSPGAESQKAELMVAVENLLAARRRSRLAVTAFRVSFDEASAALEVGLTPVEVVRLAMWGAAKYPGFGWSAIPYVSRAEALAATAVPSGPVKAGA